MKNFTFLKRLAVLPLAAVLTFASCEDKKIVSSCTVTSTDIDVTQKPAKVTAPAVGKTYNVHVQLVGDVTWTAKSSNSQVVILSKADIQNTSGDLMITVLENTTFASRTCIVDISSPALNVPVSIQVFQPAIGAPIILKTLTEGKDASKINSDGDRLSYQITATPSTELTYQIDPAATSWITAVVGKPTDWDFKANASDQIRKAWICIKYNNGQSAADTIYFTQQGAATIPTPVVAVAAADAHVRMATLKWSTSADVLATIATMHIKVGTGAVANIPVADGQYVYRTSENPNTEHAFTVSATTKSGVKTSEISGSFTTKKLTDTYLFKDGKMKENIASWLAAKRSPIGVSADQSVYLIGGGISYDTLEMVEDLKLTYQFGTSTFGMVDLLQCKNLKNIQLGRGYHDDGIGFGNVPLFQTRLGDVLTKANFPSFVKIGVGKGITAVSDDVKTAVQAVCTANSLTYVAEISLLWPNELVSNTEAKKVDDIATLSLLDRSAWKVVAWSSHSLAEGSFPNLLDGDYSTYWHSDWGAKHVLPQGFIIDFGGSITMKQVVLAMRVGGNEDSRVLKYQIEFSNDAAPTDLIAGVNYTKATYPQATDVWPGVVAGFTWSAPIVITNDISSNDKWCNIFTLPTAQTAKSMRVTVLLNKNVLNHSFNISEFGVSNK